MRLDLDIDNATEIFTTHGDHDWVATADGLVICYSNSTGNHRAGTSLYKTNSTTFIRLVETSVSVSGMGAASYVYVKKGLKYMFDTWVEGTSYGTTVTFIPFK